MEALHVSTTHHFSFYAAGQNYKFSVDVHRDARGGLTAVDIKSPSFFNVEGLVALRDFIDGLLKS